MSENVFNKGDHVLVVNPLEQGIWLAKKGHVGIATTPSSITMEYVHLRFEDGETAAFYTNQVEHAKSYIIHQILSEI